MDLCNYNLERLESLTNKHQCSCSNEIKNAHLKNNPEVLGEWVIQIQNLSANCENKSYVCNKKKPLL